MPRKKKAPEPLAHILFADAERQNLQRRLLRHIVALRLKELDSLTSLENLLAYHGIPRLDLIEAIMENLAVQAEFRPPGRDSLCPSGAAFVSTMPAPSGFPEVGRLRKSRGEI